MIRVLTTLHENLGDEIQRRIYSWLDSLPSGSNQLADITTKIRGTGARDLSLKILGKIDTKQADKSFTYKGCGYPGLVIEISESAADVGKKAKAYIQGTKGQIRTVIYIGSNGAYPKKGGPATFSIWRTDFSQEHLDVIESANNQATLS